MKPSLPACFLGLEIEEPNSDWRKRENLAYVSGIIASELYLFGCDHSSEANTVLDHVLHALNDPEVSLS